MTKKKGRKAAFSAVKAVKEMARERVGRPPAGKIVPNKKDRERTRESKYKKSLAELADRRSDQ